jgi:hypothetical protein
MILAVVAMLLLPLEARAQSTATGPDPASATRAEALANVENNRSLMIRDMLDRWRSQFRPFDPARNIGGEEGRLTTALQTASAEKLLVASQAQTYEELLAALYGRWQGPSVIPLGPGPIPNALGDAGDDLVFTPVTPCRIIDTRIATDPSLLGRIGPDAGKQFSVSLANYAAQGGFAGSCGIPIAPAAVAINVTSAGQTGPGNLRAVEFGGGTPSVSLVNYNAGVNIANAAIVRSAGSLGGLNIFIYSAVSASQVIVDIMGYFAPPVATAVQNAIVVSAASSCANGANCTVLSPNCPAGYGLTGGGSQVSSFVTGVNWVFVAPWTATQWGCQAVNASGGTQGLECWATCARVPGR